MKLIRRVGLTLVRDEGFLNLSDDLLWPQWHVLPFSHWSFREERVCNDHFETPSGRPGGLPCQTFGNDAVW